MRSFQIIIFSCLLLLLFCHLPLSADGNVTVNTTVNTTPLPTLSAYSKFVYIEPALNSQPTVVYYGEIASIWNMIGWADEYGNYYVDYWFYNHSCGARPADIIVDITKPRAVPVTRDTFPYPGVYYQHQLTGETGCSPIMEVRDGYRIENETLEIAHQQNQTSPVVYDPWPELPDRWPRASYLFARYQPFNLSSTGARWFWLFSQTDYLLQQGDLVNTSSDTVRSGKYDLVLQWPGNSTPIGVFYYPETGSVRCACQPEPKEITRLPFWYQTTLLTALENQQCSDDGYALATLELQEPAVDITDIFENVNGTEDYYLYVQGYTNLAAGTVINLTIDRSRWDYHDLRRHTFNSTVYGPDITKYRKFRVKIPYDPDELRGGQHTLSAMTPMNTETLVDFWVYEIPEGMERPPTYLKYIDRNLVVPTPTPEVREVKVIVPGPERTIVVIQNVTPAPGDLVVAEREGILQAISFIVVFVILPPIVIAVLAYVGSVVYRRWKSKRK